MFNTDLQFFKQKKDHIARKESFFDKNMTFFMLFSIKNDDFSALASTHSTHSSFTRTQVVDYLELQIIKRVNLFLHTFNKLK